MTRATTLVAALAMALAAGTLSGCGQPPGGTAGPAPASERPPSAAATGQAASPTGVPGGPAARVIAVTVRGGQVSGETGRVEVAQGTPVTIRVTSDAADELHVHGYDKEVEIPAGGTVEVRFTADLPGVFEVELHESGQQLLSLQVS